MDVGNWIAFATFLVTAAGLVWTILRSLQRERPTPPAVTPLVEVIVRTAQLPRTEPIWTVRIEVYNRSNQDIVVKRAGLDALDGSGNSVVVDHLKPQASLPGPIPPNESAYSYFIPEGGSVGPAKLSLPVVGWVMLSHGERVDSKPVTLHLP
jgi:hypothetical protein